MQLKFIESIIHKNFAGCGHNPFPPELLPKPVSDHHRPVLPIDGMVSNDSGNFICRPYRRLKPLFARILFLRMTDKRLSIVDGHVAVQPWEPTAKMLTITVDQIKELFGIRSFNKSQFGREIMGKWYS